MLNTARASYAPRPTSLWILVYSGLGLSVIDVCRRLGIQPVQTAISVSAGCTGNTIKRLFEVKLPPGQRRRRAGVNLAQIILFYDRSDGTCAGSNENREHGQCLGGSPCALAGGGTVHQAKHPSLLVPKRAVSETKQALFPTKWCTNSYSLSMTFRVGSITRLHLYKPTFV